MSRHERLSRIFLPALTMTVSMAVSSQALAQARVVDASSDRGQAISTQAAPAAGAGNQNDIMVEMYLRLESLQTEIQNLRGLVEEQSYQIRRLQTESRDRYLDTDSRLTELFSFHNGQQPPSNAATPSVLNNNGQSPVAAGNAAATAVPQPMTAGAGIVSTNLSAVSTPRSEQELYRFALNQLLEEENFQESVNLFQQYIDVYPQGRYLTNSLYWQGAALHLLENYTQSISVLQRLLDEYPQDPKAATAMLRLGTVYNEMGNTQRAVDLWRRISQVYPNSTSEIELATEYLNDAGL
jgi:tol-pal system protein YbgF